MRALLIDEETIKRAEELKFIAASNIFSADHILDIHNKHKFPAGDFNKFTMEIKQGYRVVFSIEQRDIGKFRHLSVSVDTVGKYPNQEAVKEIMKLFGFERDLMKCHVRLEDIDVGHQAVNVLELITEN